MYNDVLFQLISLPPILLIPKIILTLCDFIIAFKYSDCILRKILKFSGYFNF